MRKTSYLKARDVQGVVDRRQWKMRVTYQQLVKRIAKPILGNSTLESIIAEDGKVGLRQCFKIKSRALKIDQEFRQSKINLESFCRSYFEHVAPVTSPLVLISQIQRSGGSLLSQLFDGHPELHAHPHELKIGNPKKYIWPQIDLKDDPERWFEILFEDIVIRHLRHGYKKMEKYTDTFLFIFLPALQREMFFKYLNSVKVNTIRDVFDAYMTSYFGAWVNNQNLLGQKKFVTGFTPRLATLKENMKSYFDIYPDGRLISVIRDPKNWFPSAVRHNLEKYGDVSQALNQWNESAQGMLWNKERYGDRVCIINFEDLIKRTEAVMRYLAEFLNIQFDDILVTPTYNKTPIKPNTSFKLEDPGIIVSVLNRYKTLSQEELKVIDEMTGALYAKVLGVVTSIP
jgi:hypothetical protein